jgi:methanogenic corrinoid protein MtbC1
VVSQILVALSRFDSREVARLLGGALIGLGSGTFVREVCAPLLTEVGNRWSEGKLSVAEEHLVSGALRNLLDSLGRLHAPHKSPAALLAAPSGERHEFGLLILGLLFIEEGLAIAHAGVDLPDVEIIKAAHALGVRVVGLSLVNGTNRQRAVPQVQRIADCLPGGVELWLGGRDAPNVARNLSGSRFLVLEDDGEVTAHIRRLRQIEPVAHP